MQPGALERQFFDNATLTRVAEKLRDPNCTFTLHITDGLSERVLHIADSNLQFVAIGERSYPDLQSYLTARRVADAHCVQSLMQESDSAGRRFGSVLMKRGVLSPEDFDAAMEKIGRDIFFDLVFWRDACFSLFEGNAPHDVLRHVTQEPLAHIDREQVADDLESWSERWGALQSSIHSDSAKIVLTDFGTATLQDYDGHLKDCLAACRNSHDLRNLWSKSEVDLPLLCEQLDELVKLEWVRIVPRIGGIVNSQQELGNTIKILERNVDVAIDKSLVREKLVRLYNRVRKPEMAVSHLHALAREDLERDEWSLAIDRYKKILELDASNLEAFRAVTKTYLEHNMKRDAAELIGSHARMLVTRKRFDEARAVSQTLQRLPGGRIQAKEIEAVILSGEGDKPAASKLLAQVAEAYFANGEKGRAVDTLKNALAIDSNNEKLRQRLIEMQQVSDVDTAPLERHAFAEPATDPATGFGSSRSIGPAVDNPGFQPGGVGNAPSVPQAPPGPGNASPNYSSTHATPTGYIDPAVAAANSAPTPHRKAPKIQLSRRFSWAAVFVLGVAGLLGALAYVYMNASDQIQPGGGVFGSRTAEAMELSRRGMLPQPVSPSTNVGGKPSTSTFLEHKNSIPKPVSVDEPGAAVGPSISASTPRTNDEKTRRVINDKVVATYATSEPLVLRSRSKDQKLYELPARPEEHWSIGYRGKVICQWRPGGHPRIFRPPSTKPEVLRWEIPPDTVAVAVGPNELALRRGTHTIFYPYYGKATGGGEAPLWTEGIYMGKTLFLQRPALTVDDRPEVWCLRYPDLELLWTCTLEDDAAVFR